MDQNPIFTSFEDARDALEVYRQHRGQLLSYEAVLLMQYHSLCRQEGIEESKKPLFLFLDLKSDYYPRRRRIPFMKIKVKQSRHLQGLPIDPTKTLGPINGFPLTRVTSVGPFAGRSEFLYEKMRHHQRMYDIHEDIDDLADELSDIYRDIYDFNKVISDIICQMHFMSNTQEEHLESFGEKQREMEDGFWLPNYI